MGINQKKIIKNVCSLSNTAKSNDGSFVFDKGKVPYSVPVLIKNDGKFGWYLEYQYVDKFTLNMCRGVKRLRKEIQMFENSREAEKYINTHLIKDLTAKLESGWTPKGDVVIEKNDRNSILSLLERWIDDKSDLRPDTLRVYKSAATKLRVFLKKSDLTSLDVLDWNDYTTLSLSRWARKEWSNPTTYNNYRRMWGGFFEWVKKVERIRIPNNPIFEGMVSQRENYSPRKTVPREMDPVIIKWCMEYDPVLLMLIMMISGPTFLRVQECLRIRIEDINLDERTVTLNSWQSKTKSAVKTLSSSACQMLKDFKIDEFPGNYFLFNKLPSRYGKLTIGRAPLSVGMDKTKIAQEAKGMKKTTKELLRQYSQMGFLETRDVDKNWVTLRSATLLDTDITLYSYRHRGVSELYAKGIAQDQITQLTGHLTDAFWHYVSNQAKSVVAEKVAGECEDILIGIDKSNLNENLNTIKKDFELSVKAKKNNDIMAHFNGKSTKKVRTKILE